MPRTFVAHGIATLPEAAARHVQVLRLQPGDAITLFNGDDGADWPGEIVRIGRREVDVRLGAALPVDRELADDVTIALGVPANDRMDALVEKAGELGATAIQPLLTERSVVRLSGARADARRARWQAVAAAASEQCGRARVTAVLPLHSLASWLALAREASPERRLVVLSLAASALAPAQVFRVGSTRRSICVLSGPEGGLTAAEEASAVAAGFVPVGLGPRTLRADTAPLALLAWIAGSAVAER
ncbi:MAG: 16S rRNA (uracil(1498)-N(3))-methyltransferase [Caldimonas sp.]